MEIDINKIIGDVRAASEALDSLHAAREARYARENAALDALDKNSRGE